MKILDADATVGALAWPVLIAALEAIIRDAGLGQASCPPRLTMALVDEAAWLLMPALSSRADLGACKLITVHPRNRQRGLSTIQGDILVIRASTGERLALLDGPAVTARRTAAVTVLAIRLIQAARTRAATADVLAAAPGAGMQGGPGSCLIVGAGVQGRSHLEALGSSFPALRFFLCSRTRGSAESLAAHAIRSGLAAEVVEEPEAVLDAIDLVVCCTDASQACLRAPPRQGAIIAAIGSFKPEMSELGPEVMKAIGRNILLDSADAGHEAGELVQAGITAQGLPNLFSWNDQALPAIRDTVLFKSCGNALWDLAAAEAATGAA